MGILPMETLCDEWYYKVCLIEKVHGQDAHATSEP
jgi:hypothetical protein